MTPSVPPSVPPSVGTVLVPAARTWRGWAAAVRRRPGPVVTLLGGVGAANVVLSRLGDSDVVQALQTGTWIFAGTVFRDARAGVLQGSSPLTGAPSAERRRPPVDVRTGGPVPPAWRWTGPLGRWLLVAALCAGGLLAVSATWLVEALRDGSSAALVVAVLLALGCVLGAGGLAVSVLLVPAACRRVVRHGTPTLVRVLGVEHEGQQWHVQPLDGGEVVVLPAFRGRSRLVAGDVVHLWTAPPQPDAYETRAAVTGPFGVLWPELPDQGSGAVPAAAEDRPVRD